MRKTYFISLALVFLIITTYQPSIVQAASITDTTKEYANKAMIWKDSHLKEISFRTLYPKPIYKKSYFSYIILGTTIVIGIAASYFSMGTGAPAAATGVGTVASWVGGGGAGSYMAGLSTIGGVVGGNAVTGAVILNGLSYGIIGGTMGKFAALSAAAKFGVIANVTATMMDGVAILSKDDSGKLYYTIRLTPPRNLGGKKIRKLVDEIYENEEKKFNALENRDEVAAIRYKEDNDALMKSSEKLLSEVLASKKPSQEDILVLGIINYEAGNIKSFQKAIDKLSKLELSSDRRSYIDYLTAISWLLDGNEMHALEFLEKSSRQEPYALEPQVLAINVLGSNFQKNEDLIIKKIKFMEKNYDADKYSGHYSLLAPYYRLATIYYNKMNYSQAGKFYERALDQIGFIQGLFTNGENLKKQVKLGIANCYYQQGDKYKANELYTKITDGLKGEELRNIKAQYAGTN
jgi:tetratricopeptide (TPR) repeat protein